MKWISDFHLFLFDFDGLLVNTEYLHFLAYKNMCAKRGHELTWDFAKYCSLALYEATAIKEGIYKEFPTLYQEEPNWDTLYQEKKEAYKHLLQYQDDLLMPGVEDLLKALKKANVKRCVVTHSPKEQVDLIRKKHPILETIPFWITRQDYTNPKPDPECYLTAIKKYGQAGEKVIGFEDSPRGFQALQGSNATPVLISKVISQKEISKYAIKPFFHFTTIETIHFSENK